MVETFIGIGSNLGDRQDTIEQAIARLRTLPLTKVKNVSSLQRTKPVGGPRDQNDYLNGVVCIDTGLMPFDLLCHLQSIERDLGRVRIVKDGPRTIDLDILVYGECTISELSLEVPHPRMLERGFVIDSLLEIAPNIVHTLTAKRRKTPSCK